MREIIFKALREWDVVGYEDLACVLEHKLRTAGYGETTALPDGYYWVRFNDRPRVATRIAGQWWLGMHAQDNCDITVISDRLKEPE